MSQDKNLEVFLSAQVLIFKRSILRLAAIKNGSHRSLVLESPVPVCSLRYSPGWTVRADIRLDTRLDIRLDTRLDIRLDIRKITDVCVKLSVQPLISMVHFTLCYS